jgi:hypothetical protein
VDGISDHKTTTTTTCAWLTIIYLLVPFFSVHSSGVDSLFFLPRVQLEIHSFLHLRRCCADFTRDYCYVLGHSWTNVTTGMQVEYPVGIISIHYVGWVLRKNNDSRSRRLIRPRNSTPVTQVEYLRSNNAPPPSPRSCSMNAPVETVWTAFMHVECFGERSYRQTDMDGPMRCSLVLVHEELINR